MWVDGVLYSPRAAYLESIFPGHVFITPYLRLSRKDKMTAILDPGGMRRQYYQNRLTVASYGVRPPIPKLRTEPVRLA
jgi:hypothetical protein